VIVGENGQGKTSFIEALLYSEVFRSCRGAGDRELVRFGADGFYLKAVVGGQGSPGSRVPSGPESRVLNTQDRTVAAGYDARTKAKKVTVDGAEPERLADAIGIVRGVVLSPGDVGLVAGGPRERRHYLDMLLALTEAGYLEALSTYRRALRHRNHATGADAAVWEAMLAEAGAAITRSRKAFVERWAPAYRAHCTAMGERGEPALGYASRTDGSAAALREALERSRERDLARGRTSVGPHRDDLRLLLDARDLRDYGSAGQQRTASLALRLIEAEAQEDATGVPVIVCLDDAFAELDAVRGANLGAMIERMAAAGSQVVAAVPKESDVPEVIASLPRWHVVDGRVEPQV
jgi:DNA replication and repair protein RecF